MLCNYDHLFGVVSQARVSGGNRTHNPHANSLAHFALENNLCPPKMSWAVKNFLIAIHIHCREYKK